MLAPARIRSGGRFELISMENFEKQELKIVVENSGRRVRWLGKSTARQPGTFLIPYMDRMIAAAPETVEVDFTGLRFMNSPTVMPILVLLNGLSGRGLAVTVVYDSKTPWQKTVFGGLRAFTFKGDGTVEFQER